MRLSFASAVFACATAAVVATGGAQALPSPPGATASPSASPSAKLSKWQQAQLERYRDSAPADEYFGKMKMSYLGMNNTFRDASISSGDHTVDPNIVNKMALAEDALEDWARKYPHDPQLARTYYLATIVERKIWLKPNQERAWIYLNRLVQLFPDSYFGKHLKADLAIGFTEHYYALPEPCATPTPAPTPPPFEFVPDAGFVAEAMEAAAATPAPTPTPSPVPTPVALEKGLSVLVIPQACVPRETPSPSPSPSALP